MASTTDSGSTPTSESADSDLSYHMSLLGWQPEEHDLKELTSTPLFTRPVLDHARRLARDGDDEAFSQYALLAGSVDTQQEGGGGDSGGDPRIFHNVSTPSSAFICGNQGSGKSHTLSCLLEGCLLPSRLGELPHPLAAIVFHYDTFISDSGGQPCEAAYLASHEDIRVRVLCAPTNIATIKAGPPQISRQDWADFFFQATYSQFHNVTVEELRFDEANLNTQRMLDLMAVGEGGLPLYLVVIQRILREMRLEQQESGSKFNYRRFKQMIDGSGTLVPNQIAPLRQRLDTLESFMVQAQVQDQVWNMKKTAPKQQQVGNKWAPTPGEMIIVDLSCPCVTPEMACSLFNICLSLFLERNKAIGRVIALDEAHKYMNESPESLTLTNRLLSSIRLQRHLGARIFISTQEPTISPKLLDLCSMTIVHRFTSPGWLKVLRGHLAGISTASKVNSHLSRTDDENALLDGLKGFVLTSEEPALELFSAIVQLKVGEALLFAPGAIVSLKGRSNGTSSGEDRSPAPQALGHEVLKIRVRARLTNDGGRSIFAM